MKQIPIQINDDGEIELVMPDISVEDGDILVTGDGVCLPVVDRPAPTVLERLEGLEHEVKQQIARVDGLYERTLEHKRWLESLS